MKFTVKPIAAGRTKILEFWGQPNPPFESYGCIIKFEIHSVFQTSNQEVPIETNKVETLVNLMNIFELTIEQMEQISTAIKAHYDKWELEKKQGSELKENLTNLFNF